MQKAAGQDTDRMTPEQKASTMINFFKTDRRWLNAVILASAQPLPSFPWIRSENRPDRKPAQIVSPEGYEEASAFVATYGGKSAIAAS